MEIQIKIVIFNVFSGLNLEVIKASPRPHDKQYNQTLNMSQNDLNSRSFVYSRQPSASSNITRLSPNSSFRSSVDRSMPSKVAKNYFKPKTTFDHNEEKSNMLKVSISKKIILA